MAPSNLAVVQRNTYDYLMQPSIMDKVKRACVDHLKPERMHRVFLTTVMENPKLTACHPRSLLRCLLLSAQLGLEPGPLGLVAYVPYKGMAQFITMYRGKIDLAYRSGMIKKVSAMPVYKNDEFDYQYGLEEMCYHKPTEGDRGGLRGAYCIFWTLSGETIWRYLPEIEILEDHKRHSPTANNPDSPWNKFPAPMYAKTAVHVVAKMVKLSPQFELTQWLDDMELKGVNQMDLQLPDGFGEIENETPPGQDEIVLTGARDGFEQIPPPPPVPESVESELKQLVLTECNKKDINIGKFMYEKAWPAFFEATRLGQEKEEDRDSARLGSAMISDFDNVWASFEGWYASNYGQAGVTSTSKPPNHDEQEGAAPLDILEEEKKIVMSFRNLKDSKTGKHGLPAWLQKHRVLIPDLSKRVRDLLDQKCRNVFGPSTGLESAMKKWCGAQNTEQEPQEPVHKPEVLDPEPQISPESDETGPNLQSDTETFPDYCPIDRDSLVDESFKPNKAYFDARCPDCDFGRENCAAWKSVLSD